MNDQSCNADIPVMLNGNQKCNLSKDSNGIVLTFSSKEPVHIPFSSISAALWIKTSSSSKAAICLNTASHVLPSAKKTVSSFIIERIPLAQASAHFSTVHQPKLVQHTSCGRHTVTHGPGIAVWSNRTCTHIAEVQHVVMQRTTGGMSTFDVHVVPKEGAIVTVEMLPHACIESWKNQYADRVLDFGADPINVRLLEQARQSNGIEQYFQEKKAAGSDADASMSECDDDEYVEEDSASMSESSDSECDPTSSECESEIAASDGELNDGDSDYHLAENESDSE